MFCRCVWAGGMCWCLLFAWISLVSQLMHLPYDSGVKYYANVGGQDDPFFLLLLVSYYF
jgi:hypothetical protein